MRREAGERNRARRERRANRRVRPGVCESVRRRGSFEQRSTNEAAELAGAQEVGVDVDTAETRRERKGRKRGSVSGSGRRAGGASGPRGLRSNASCTHSVKGGCWNETSNAKKGERKEREGAAAPRLDGRPRIQNLLPLAFAPHLCPRASTLRSPRGRLCLSRQLVLSTCARAGIRNQRICIMCHNPRDLCLSH